MQGCAQRCCRACASSAFIGGSEEFWESAAPGDAAFPCGEETFEVAVGYSVRSDDEIGWITVGGRCIECGVLGVYVDWKID